MTVFIPSPPLLCLSKLSAPSLPAQLSVLSILYLSAPPTLLLPTPASPPPSSAPNAFILALSPGDKCLQ